MSESFWVFIGTASCVRSLGVNECHVCVLSEILGIFSSASLQPQECRSRCGMDLMLSNGDEYVRIVLGLYWDSPLYALVLKSPEIWPHSSSFLQSEECSLGCGMMSMFCHADEYVCIVVGLHWDSPLYVELLSNRMILWFLPNFKVVSLPLSSSCNNVIIDVDEFSFCLMPTSQ